MTTQPNLFDQFRESRSVQPTLFDDGPQLSSRSCRECGGPLERTPSGYLVCCNGHGGLVEDTKEEKER